MNIPDDGFFTLVTQGIQHRSDETLQRALYHTLRHAILQGTLAANCRLPGSRVMAGRLQLSRNTVNAALEQLALEGYLMRSRQGTQVVPLAACREEPVKVPPVVLPERLQGLPAAMRRDSPALLFTPGMPAVNYFPLPLWRRLMDNVLRDEGSALLGYGEAAGDPLLREAIARHLALSRGIRCDHYRRGPGRGELMRFAVDGSWRQRVGGRAGLPGGQEQLPAGRAAGQRDGGR